MTKELEKALRHIKTRADAWAVKEIEKALSQESCRKDCRLCKEFDECENGKKGHKNGTSIGYSIGECKDYKPCTDVVSREMALNSLIDNTHLDGYDLAEALDAIENKEKLPSVTPSCDKCAMNGSGSKYCDNCGQKSGKWIDREEYDADRWKCSVCGRTEQYKENYCPNCGAKMESEDKE